MVDKPDEIVHISIFDMMGRPIVTIEHSTVKSYMAISFSQRLAICVVQVYGGNWS